jgi:uncharacterized protein
MPVYHITYAHPDEAGWQQHLIPHILWLQARLKDGSLLASGPFPDAAQKEAMLIMRAPDRAAIDALIATDPFAIEGLIADMTVQAWDPIFGVFNEHSSMSGTKSTDLKRVPRDGKKS